MTQTIFCTPIGNSTGSFVPHEPFDFSMDFVGTWEVLMKWVWCPQETSYLKQGH